MSLRKSADKSAEDVRDATSAWARSGMRLNAAVKRAAAARPVARSQRLAKHRVQALLLDKLKMSPWTCSYTAASARCDIQAPQINL